MTMRPTVKPGERCPHCGQTAIDLPAMLAAAPPEQNADPQSAQPQESVEPCCGNYVGCLRPCTPRGVWQGKRESQATIDRLMLEYCPDEMTPEQTAEWASNQRKSAQQATAAVESDREHVSPAVADLDGLVKRLRNWIKEDPRIFEKAAAAISQLRREVAYFKKEYEILEANYQTKSIALQQAESSVAELEAKCKMVFEQRDGSVASVGDLCQMKERVEELTAKLAEAERDTIERCAKLCKGLADKNTAEAVYEKVHWSEAMADGNTECAAAIRALLPKAEKEGK